MCILFLLIAIHQAWELLKNGFSHWSYLLTWRVGYDSQKVKHYSQYHSLSSIATLKCVWMLQRHDTFLCLCEDNFNMVGKLGGLKWRWPWSRATWFRENNGVLWAQQYTVICLRGCFIICRIGNHFTLWTVNLCRGQSWFIYHRHVGTSLLQLGRVFKNQ